MIHQCSGTESKVIACLSEVLKSGEKFEGRPHQLKERWNTLHHVLACVSDQKEGKKMPPLGCHSAGTVDHLRDHFEKNTVWMTEAQ